MGRYSGPRKRSTGAPAISTAATFFSQQTRKKSCKSSTGRRMEGMVVMFTMKGLSVSSRVLSTASLNSSPVS